MDVVYVDERDSPIGAGSIDNALNNGIRMRVARVFLMNDKGELLIQKRSDTHKSLPGRWDHTAAGHVDEGESYRQAAERELAEEMGITGVEIKEVAKFYSEEKDESRLKKRFNLIFTGIYDGPVTIDEHEVSASRWVRPDVLAQEMADHPQQFTEGFIRAFRIFKDKSNSIKPA